MTNKDERRKEGVDRRAEVPSELPVRDREGAWIFADRREGERRNLEAGRRERAQVFSRRKKRIALMAVLVFVVLVVLIRIGIIDAPFWLPVWVIYPDIFIERLLSDLGL